MLGYKVPLKVIENYEQRIKKDAEFVQGPNELTKAFCDGVRDAFAEIRMCKLINLDTSWHTGTPIEEGMYILLTDFMLDGLSSSGGTYTLDYWDGYAFKYLQKEAEMNAVFKPNKYSWIAWQKIEPYKEKEDGHID